MLRNANYFRPGYFRVSGCQLIGQMRRRLAYQGELLYDRTSDKFRRLEARTIKTCYELRDIPGCLDNVAEVQLLTPHRRAARLGSRNRE